MDLSLGYKEIEDGDGEELEVNNEEEQNDLPQANCVDNK